MPELPEVQLVADGIAKDCTGDVIVDVEVFWPGYIVGADRETLVDLLIGQTIRKTGRRGKFILIYMDRHNILLHLRMTGKVLTSRNPGEPPLHTHLVLTLVSGISLAFNDVRKFGRFELVPVSAWKERLKSLNLGWEPFEEGYTSENLGMAIAGKSRSIKNILLDQRVIAGIGNIYACEILFEAGIDPFRTGGGLNREELERIVSNTRLVLLRAIDRGGASISDYVGVNGESGRMQNFFKVYGRENEECMRCGGTVARVPDIGRSTFLCPSCQE
jgi:formamidopyrimidine-DNA glycosylase